MNSSHFSMSPRIFSASFLHTIPGYTRKSDPAQQQQEENVLDLIVGIARQPFAKICDRPELSLSET
jgi:hypothetical protein